MAQSPIESGATSPSSRSAPPDSAAPIDPGDILRLLYEAAQATPGGASELDSLLARAAAAEVQRLGRALEERGEKLADAERQAFAEAKRGAVAAVLERIRRREEAKQTPGTAAVVGRGDGITQAGVRPSRLAGAAQELLPTHEPGGSGPDATAGGPTHVPPDARAAPPAPGFGKITAAVADTARLTVLRRELMQLLAAPSPAAAAHGVAKLSDGDKREIVLGTAAPRATMAGGSRTQGHSGEAGRLPLATFMPADRKAVLAALGLHTLADFLNAARGPAGRRLLAEACGVPRTTVFLATLRAELLDLPPLEWRYATPLLKDVVLLARLGLGSCAALRRLAELFDAAPARLEALGKLVGALQKAVPESVGRQRITKVELKAWAQAAARRGSDVDAGAGAQDSVAAAAEQVLAWYLTERTVTSDALWHDVVTRAYAELHAHGTTPDEALQHAINVESSESTREALRALCARRLAASRGQEDDDARRLEVAYDAERTLERERFADYVWQRDELSLFSGLEPWVRPAAARPDGLICFWMEPVPMHRQALGASEGGADAQRPAYVCLDPQSGAIVPFDAA